MNDDFLSGDSPLKNIKELKVHLNKILKNDKNRRNILLPSK